MRIIKYNKYLDIRNIDALPAGKNTKYLEVIEGIEGSYIAKAWRHGVIQGNNKNIILIEF